MSKAIKTTTTRGLAAAVVLALIGWLPAAGQSGHVLNGIGPVGQAWSGAGMAMPADALTALHWNPASIATIGTEVNLSIQFLEPKGSVVSTVNAGAFGPVFGPPVTLSGSTDSNAGPFPIPAVGGVYSPDAAWTIGLSAFGVGGFGVDYDIDPANPILTPQPPNGLGFGALFSEFALLQVAPTVAYRFDERLSVGVAPTLNYATLKVGPFPATTPDDANGDGFPSYPIAPKDAAVGIGAQVGVHFQDPSGFSAGLSFKTRQVFADFEFEAVDEMGAPRPFQFNLDYPAILSAAVGYAHDNGVDLVADLRYIDFENTDGFALSGFGSDGAVEGFGWKSVIVVAVGVQYHVTDELPIRVGYSFNQNPIEDDVSFFNTPAPAIIQHRVSGGIGYRLSDKVEAAVAVQYGAKNEISGFWIQPGFGENTGTDITNELATLSGTIGVAIHL